MEAVDDVKQSSNAAELIRQMREKLEALRSLSRHLSGTYSDDLTQHQLEAEIAAAEHIVAQLTEQLTAYAEDQSDGNASRLDQMSQSVVRLQGNFDKLRTDFDEYFAQLVTNSDHSSARDNYRLLQTRVDSHSRSVDHLLALLDSLVTNDQQTTIRKDDLAKQLRGMQDGCRDLSDRIQVQMQRSFDAEQTQHQLLDKIQTASAWLSETRDKFDRQVPATAELSSTGDSQLVANVKAQLREARLRTDFDEYFAQLVTNSDHSSARDNYRLLQTRVDSHSRSVDHLLALLDSLVTNDQQTTIRKDDLARNSLEECRTA
ncbi:hypothetical protein AHF37_02573, partial [Paragonimus kellicotti]